MLSKYHLFILLLSFIPFTSLFAQNDFIHTKEGNNILRKRELINNCLDALIRTGAMQQYYLYVNAR
jgi:hypothetical protein